MTKDYRQLIEKINARSNPEGLRIEKELATDISHFSHNNTLVFIRTAMNAVDPAYTKKSKDAGERVKEHLDKNLSNKTFRYQGSVMTNTHIKGVSDIDLLVISTKFYTYDLYEIDQILGDNSRKSKYYSWSIEKMENIKKVSNYSGDSLSDLKSLRLDSENSLRTIYSSCDISKPKSIKIKNLNLNREVDVVIANWYDDVKSIINDKGDFRGVQVYDKSLNSVSTADYPFLSIKRINDRSSATGGRLKKMIRFLKNLKALSQFEITLTSFDINAICYDIESEKYQSLIFYELVRILFHQLKSLSTNIEHSNNLVSVDGKEYIFRHNQKKLDEMRLLLNEVEVVFFEI